MGTHQHDHQRTLAKSLVRIVRRVVHASAQAKVHKEAVKSLGRQVQVLDPFFYELAMAPSVLPCGIACQKFELLQGVLTKMVVIVEKAGKRTNALKLFFKGNLLDTQLADVTRDMSRCLMGLPLAEMSITSEVKDMVSELVEQLARASYEADADEQQIIDVIRSPRGGKDAKDAAIMRVSQHLQVPPESVRTEWERHNLDRDLSHGTGSNHTSSQADDLDGLPDVDSLHGGRELGINTTGLPRSDDQGTTPRLIANVPYNQDSSSVEDGDAENTGQTQLQIVTRPDISLNLGLGGELAVVPSQRGSARGTSSERERVPGRLRDKDKPLAMLEWGGDFRKDDTSQQDSVPESYICYMCNGLLAEAVVVATGHSYCKKCAKALFNKSGHLTCPRSGQPLQSIMMIPNLALQQLVRDWLKAHPAASSPCAPPLESIPTSPNSSVGGASNTGTRATAPSESGSDKLERATLAIEHQEARHRRLGSNALDLPTGTSRNEKPAPAKKTSAVALRQSANGPRNPAPVIPPSSPREANSPVVAQKVRRNDNSFLSRIPSATLTTDRFLLNDENGLARVVEDPKELELLMKQQELLKQRRQQEIEMNQQERDGWKQENQASEAQSRRHRRRHSAIPWHSKNEESGGAEQPTTPGRAWQARSSNRGQSMDVSQQEREWWEGTEAIRAKKAAEDKSKASTSGNALPWHGDWESGSRPTELGGLEFPEGDGAGWRGVPDTQSEAAFENTRRLSTDSRRGSSDSMRPSSDYSATRTSGQDGRRSPPRAIEAPPMAASRAKTASHDKAWGQGAELRSSVVRGQRGYAPADETESSPWGGDNRHRRTMSVGVEPRGPDRYRRDDALMPRMVPEGQEMAWGAEDRRREGTPKRASVFDFVTMDDKGQIGRKEQTNVRDSVSLRNKARPPPPLTSEEHENNTYFPL